MKWEYKVIVLTRFLYSDEDLTIEEKLDQYGADGLELVCALEKPHAIVGNPPKFNSDSLLFKRAIA